MGSSRGVDVFKPYNPDTPYFAIKIEDRVYDIDVNYIESLTVHRTVNDVGTFNFTIDNAADLNLENKFLNLFYAYTNSQPPISFQYGWAKGVKSKWYRGFLQNYNPEFLPGGYMRLGVNGELLGPDDTLERIACYKGNRMSDIVAAIAEDMGWVVEEIEPSELMSTYTTERITNVNAIDYIRKDIEPKTCNSKKEPYKFYAETLDGNQTHIWFVSVNKKVGQLKNYNYYINFGNFGSVLSWAPRYEGITMAGWLQDAVFDLDTNDICVYGNAAKSAAKEGAVLTVHGASNPDHMGPILANKWYESNIGVAKASLTIVGDPTIVPHQQINVLPMEANGRLHRFTSGTYFITEINDTIAADFQTQMELVQIGDADGTKTLPLVEAVEFKGSV